MAKRGQRGGDDWVQPSTRMSEEEQTMILRMLKEGLNQVEIAKKLGRHHSAISRFCKRMFGTTELAEQYLKSKSLEMAKKVVKHATVEETIEVLSRPNIGVLAPVKQVESGPRILISVGQDSIGAIQSGQRDHLGLTPGQDHGKIGSGLVNEPQETVPARSGPGENGPQGREIHVRAQEQVTHPPSSSAPASARRSAALPDSEDASRSGRGQLETFPRPIPIPRVKKDASRKAIKGRAGGRSGIHLRYDIVEPEEDS